MAPNLSKSKYLSGLQCSKRLWIETNRRDLITSATDSAPRPMRLGSQVGMLARTYFPAGVVIRGRGRTLLARTQAALRTGETCLFEAAFVYEDVFIRCDVLCRRADGSWSLYEVKSATQMKTYHLDDIAVQIHVLRGTGLNVTHANLVLINSRDCRHPDLSNLFRTIDVTRAIEKRQAKVARELASMRAMLCAEQPDRPIGSHCTDPFPCPVRSHCWQDVPTPSIFSIPRLASDKVDALAKRGLLRLDEIPANFPLSAAQWSYVERAVSGRAEIDIGMIKAQMEELQYPLYFLDFETYSHPIPQFAGLAPYEQYPFQYSCHILHRDGSLDHRGYLHGEATDPRVPLAKSLVRDLGSSGTVLVYNAAFESRVIQELARAIPCLRARLLRSRRRLWDQLDIFRYYYLDPRFEGSNSIKKVLPVLAPHLSYATLPIQNGQQAQIGWEKMLATSDPNERQDLENGLNAYCALDTLAMVEIHRALCALLSTK